MPELVGCPVRKKVRRLYVLTLLMVVVSGCANLRLPALDPYGRRIFLPRPAYTTLSTRDRLRDCRLFPNRPRPAYTAPDSPPPPCESTFASATPQPRRLGLLDRRHPLLDCLFGPCEDEQAAAADPTPYAPWANSVSPYCIDACGYSVAPTTICYDPCASFPVATGTPVPGYCYDLSQSGMACGAVGAGAYPLGYTDTAPLGGTAQNAAAGHPAYAPSPNPPTGYSPAAQSQPAYVQPVSPPNFSLPQNRQLAYAKSSGTRGIYAAKLQLDPQRLIAPVGSEVVLRAGLCGDDGYLITKEPIEWSLSQDSVGSFVEVDEFKKPFWRKMLHKYPTKRSGSYAIGRTSTSPQVLTRGTVDTRDDIWLAEGQTWISLTSASEGVSHVSVVAPSAAGWGERRQQGSVYWIDGRWTLPQPAFARIGTSHQVTTNVRRTSTGAPIQGWIVRYEVIDGASTDGTNQKRTLDVTTDEHGNASVNVSPLSSAPGVTSIGIQIYRVGQRIGDYERVLIGQGQTSVTWTGSVDSGAVTTPGPYTPSGPSPSIPADTRPSISTATRLNVDISGPPIVSRGQDATYLITVENEGTMPAERAHLSVRIPNGMQFVEAPNGGNFGESVSWSLQTVSPGSPVRQRVTLRANGPGPFSVCADVRADNSASSQNCAQTSVTAPAPPVTPGPTTPEPNRPAPGASPTESEIQVDVSGPTRATVGDVVRFRVTLRNRGTRPALVKVRDDFDSGFGHVEGQSPIEVPLTLAGGQTRELPLNFTATTPGQQCHTLTVSSNVSSPTSKRACVNVVPRGTAPPPGSTPPPNLDSYQAAQVQVTARLSKNGVPATTFQVGDTVRIEFDVRNNGNQPLTNLQVIDRFDPRLVPTAALPAGPGRDQLSLNRLVWYLDRLEPGASEQFQIEVNVQQTATARPACHTLTVYTSQGRSIGEREACIQVDQGASPIGLSFRPISSPGAGEGPMLGVTSPVSMRIASRRPTEASTRSPSRRETSRGNESLRVTVSDLGDPAYIDQRLTYVVVIRNNREFSDRNVVLTITLPEGARFETAITPPMIRARKSTPDRRTVEFLPIAELRGSESATFRIVAECDRTGLGTFRAEVASARNPLPIVVTEETTFFAE